MATPDRRAPGRAQRIDARTNRVRILDVAEEVFGKAGRSASTEEVARLAEVGIATVFRHFPTKAPLVEAVLVRRFDRLRDHAESLLHAPDPGTAFFDFFTHLVADAATKIAIGEALADLTAHTDDSPAAQSSLALRRAFAALLRRAQQAGAVRPDAELPEVYALLVATSRTTTHLEPDTRTRMLTILFDGLTPH